MAPNISKFSDIEDHPTVQAAFQAWTELRTKGTEFYRKINVPIPLQTLHWVIPNIRLHKWIEGNFQNLADIMLMDKLMPFTDIKHKFNIPSTELFTYTQISSFYQNSKVTQNMELYPVL